MLGLGWKWGSTANQAINQKIWVLIQLCDLRQISESEASASPRVEQSVGCRPSLCVPSSPRFVGSCLSVGSETSGRSGFSTWGRSLACFPSKIFLSSLRPGNGPNVCNSHEGLISVLPKLTSAFLHPKTGELWPRSDY
jgi:hypothetical protein